MFFHVTRRTKIRNCCHHSLKTRALDQAFVLGKYFAGGARLLKHQRALGFANDCQRHFEGAGGVGTDVGRDSVLRMSFTPRNGLQNRERQFLQRPGSRKMSLWHQRNAGDLKLMTHHPPLATTSSVPSLLVSPQSENRMQVRGAPRLIKPRSPAQPKTKNWSVICWQRGAGVVASGDG